MGSRKAGKREADGELADAPGGWPGWARGLVSAFLLFHLSALLAAVAGGGLPFSELQRELYECYIPYYELVYLGHPYRYYAPEPPPTPVVEATIRYADGRPNAMVRLPGRDVRPLLRYQRQLALAYHLENDFQNTKGRTGDGSLSRLARSYARHLCLTHKGCASVSLAVRSHRIPPIKDAYEALRSPGWKPVNPYVDPDEDAEDSARPGGSRAQRAAKSGRRFDPDAEIYYDAPERIGEYPCEGF